MGTNYYLYKICSHCNTRLNEVHVGKASAGWKFNFNGSAIKTANEWIGHLKEHADELHDEYGRKEDVDKFLAYIESKKDGLDHLTCEYHPVEWQIDRRGHQWLSECGKYRFYDGEFR